MSETPRLDKLMRTSSENPFSDAVCLIEELERELAAKSAEVERLRAFTFLAWEFWCEYSSRPEWAQDEMDADRHAMLNRMKAESEAK